MAIKNLLSTLTGGLLFTGQAPPTPSEAGVDNASGGDILDNKWDANDAASGMASKYFGDVMSLRNGGAQKQILSKIGSMMGSGEKESPIEEGDI